MEPEGRLSYLQGPLPYVQQYRNQKLTIYAL